MWLLLAAVHLAVLKKSLSERCPNGYNYDVSRDNGQRTEHSGSLCSGLCRGTCRPDISVPRNTTLILNMIMSERNRSETNMKPEKKNKLQTNFKEADKQETKDKPEMNVEAATKDKLETNKPEKKAKPVGKSVKCTCPTSHRRETVNGFTSCYHLSFRSEKWQEARTTCRKLRRNLVSIETKEEMEFLMKLHKKYGNMWITKYWTSGKYLQGNDAWVWSATGAKFRYTNWATGQPFPWTRHALRFGTTSFTWYGAQERDTASALCEETCAG